MSKMTLYEINAAIAGCVDVETGEIIDFDRLDELALAREEKLENIALYIKNIDAFCADIREEEKALAARRKTKENEAARLREYLAHNLDGQKFETPRVKLSWRASAGVKVTEERELRQWLAQNHPDCLKYKLPEISLDGVKGLLKLGEIIPGVVLEQRNNLQMK